MHRDEIEVDSLPVRGWGSCMDTDGAIGSKQLDQILMH
jgi:hypothetical protein